jgi:hypothetical protein
MEESGGARKIFLEGGRKGGCCAETASRTDGNPRGRRSKKKMAEAETRS